MTVTWQSLGIDTRGATTGEHKTTCPRCSHLRKKKNYPCLNLNLDKGLFNCWHCGWGGSLGHGEERRPEAPKIYRRPEYVMNRTELPENVVAWFAQRGISQGTLIRNKIGYGKEYFPQVERERSCTMFPFYRGDECVNVKYRTADKLFRLASGAERVLYGINDIEQELIWVEGEMDKLAVEEAGLTNCVSVPDGAPTPETKNYTNKFDFMDCEQLATVRKHIIAVDNDAPGRRLQEELIRRLGIDSCVVVTWPEGCKDANDVLIQHGPRTLKECIEAALPLPIEGTCTAEDLKAQILRRYNGEVQRGISTGWDCVDRYYTVLPGEWTLVTGIPGHGKSEWLDALAMHLASDHGWNFGVFSPENHPPDYHSEKLIEKYVGLPFSEGPTQRMSVAQLNAATDFIADHFTFMMPEIPSLEALLEQAGRLVTRKGIQGLIMDPWNEIEHARAQGQTETDYISVALSKIRKFCWKHGVHTWVVAHPAKLYKDKDSGDYPVPTPYDVSGSAHWRNKADNCITVYRDMKDNSKPVAIHIQKVRKKFVGHIGMAELRYDRVTGRYTDWAGFKSDYSMRRVGE